MVLRTGVIMAVTALGIIATAGVLGMAVLAALGRDTPQAIVAVVSAAVGALTGLISVAIAESARQTARRKQKGCENGEEKDW